MVQLLRSGDDELKKIIEREKNKKLNTKKARHTALTVILKDLAIEK